MTTPYSSPRATRIASVITAFNVSVAAGLSILGLIDPASILPAHYVPTVASSVFAMYAAARTIPLAVITLVAIFKRSASALLTMGTLAGVIQLLNSIVGMVQHDPGKILGPLVIAVLQFYALTTLRKAAHSQP
jgi:hypothetical protein